MACHPFDRPFVKLRNENLITSAFGNMSFRSRRRRNPYSASLQTIVSGISRGSLEMTCLSYLFAIPQDVLRTGLSDRRKRRISLEPLLAMVPWRFFVATLLRMTCFWKCQHALAKPDPHPSIRPPLCFGLLRMLLKFGTDPSSLSEREFGSFPPRLYWRGCPNYGADLPVKSL
jgi:hypothetical protein